MDPITRREAQKIEQVLLDLVRDLEMLSYLPLDFDFWLRDDILHLVDKASTFLDPDYVEECFDASQFPAEAEERQKLLKARSFLRAASFFGDPADSEGNEAVIQVAEYAEVERHVREAASTIGTVGADELEFQRLSLRALVDTLRTGGYAKEMRWYLHRYFPFSHSSSPYHFLSACSPTEGRGGGTSSSSSTSSDMTSATSLSTSSSSLLLSSSASSDSSSNHMDDPKREGKRQEEAKRGRGGGGASSGPMATISSSSHKKGGESRRQQQHPQKTKATKKKEGTATPGVASGTTGKSSSPSSFSHKNPSGQESNESKNKKKKKKRREREDMDVDYSIREACASGIVNHTVENLRHVVYRLYRMIQLRNASTVNEDVHRYKVLHEAVNKEQSATADVQALNREYEEVKASRRREVALLDEEIVKLEEELRYVKRAADVELEAFHEVSAKMEKDHRQGYQEQLEVHRQAAEAVKEKMKRAQLDHTEKTNQLRSLRAKKEAAVSGAIVEYETQMSTMTQAMKKLQKEYEEETAKVLEIEDQLVLLQKEKKEYEVEQQVKERREKHHHEIREELEHNARVLQGYFRAYLARVKFEKEVAAKAKKKKKKKTGK